MVAEWATLQPQSEYRWRRIAQMRAAGVRNQDVHDALHVLVAETGVRCGTIKPAAWRSALPRREPLGEHQIELINLDAIEPSGDNPYHWMIVLDYFDGPTHGGRRRVALLADPLNDRLRTEPCEALARAGVHLVYRIERPAPPRLRETSPRPARDRRPSARPRR